MFIITISLYGNTERRRAKCLYDLLYVYSLEMTPDGVGIGRSYVSAYLTRETTSSFNPWV